MAKWIWGVFFVGAMSAVILGGSAGCGGSGGGSTTVGLTATASTATATSATASTSGMPGFAAVQVAPKVAGVFPSGLNDSGVVVGLASPHGTSVAFTWSASGGYTQLTPPGTITKGAAAAAINNGGTVVGYGSNASNHSRALVWTNGVAQDIGDVGGGVALAYGINTTNQAVGYSFDSSGNIQAFSWTSAGGIVNLDTPLQGPNEAWAINDAGVIVGGTGDTGQDGFAYSPTFGLHSLGDLGGGTSIGRAVNASNEVVGLAQDVNNVNHAFTWTLAGGIKALAEPTGTTTSSAYAVNAGGTVAGSVVGSAEQACTWNSAGTIQLLTPITTGLPSGVKLVYAIGINAGGQVLAQGSDNNAYLLTPSQGPAVRRIVP